MKRYASTAETWSVSKDFGHGTTVKVPDPVPPDTQYEWALLSTSVADGVVVWTWERVVDLSA